MEVTGNLRHKGMFTILQKPLNAFSSERIDMQLGWYTLYWRPRRPSKLCLGSRSRSLTLFGIKHLTTWKFMKNSSVQSTFQSWDCILSGHHSNFIVTLQYERSALNPSFDNHLCLKQLFCWTAAANQVMWPGIFDQWSTRIVPQECWWESKPAAFAHKRLRNLVKRETGSWVSTEVQWRS